MADELKELPRSWLERKLGDLGVGLSAAGRAMAEGVAPLAEKYPVRHWLSENLLTSPLQSAGAALQDYTATPRDITPEYPYRARLFDPRQPAMVDPRVLDVAQFAAPVAGRVSNAARFALPDLKAAAIAAYGPDVSAAHVVKPTKGGNWLPGDVENSMAHLINNTYVPNFDRLVGQNITDQANAQANALRSWVDTKLTRYIKNELATPEDPVRALAERNISHLQNEYEGVNAPSPTIMDRRIAAGQNWRGAGESPLARQWDYRADSVVRPTDAKSLSAFERDQLFGNKLVPPETVVYRTNLSPVFELEFEHLTDELRNALDPASGLPRNLQLTPEQLSKVTVPQAVERVAKINAWRAAQKAEADAARASTAATVTHREYQTIPGTDTPNERGLRWVELTAGEKAKAKVVPMESGGWTIEDITGHQMFGGFKSKEGAERALAELSKSDPRYKEGFSEEKTKALEDALKYEGETMGHCVGGYCPEVVAGRTRIYSLRDAKGQPHVTIEVRPNQARSKYERDWFMSQPEDVQEQITKQALAEHGATKETRTPEEDRLTWGQAISNAIKSHMGEVPDEIIQIKGKGNRKPNDEYLPFVQDFVRSGQWSDVGDFQNAGLYRKRDFINEFTPEQLNSTGIKKYLTWDEIRKLREGKAWKPIDTDPDLNIDVDNIGMKRGGAVNMAEGGEVKMDSGRVDDILNRLRREMSAEVALPEMGHADPLRFLDYARRLSVTGGGARDEHGVGMGGRMSYTHPAGRGWLVQPYVEGSYFKPVGGPAQKSVTGGGVNVILPFAEGGPVKYDPNKVDELVSQLREEIYG